MLLATGLAALGGLFWSFGILGKRIGVHGSSNETKDIRATCTICIYTLTTLIPTLVDFAGTDKELIRQTFQEPTWTRRIPGIMACGAISGLGGVMGTIAFAWSVGVNSALISMVENGMYTMFGAVVIALFFGEHPPPLEYVAAILILGGILLAQSTSHREHHHHGQGAGKGYSSEEGEEAPPPTNVPCLDVEHSAAHQDDGRKSAEEREKVDMSLATVDSDSDDTSDASDSEIAPTRLRKRAVVLAILAGMCWGFGPLGKKYGVTDAPEGSKHVWTTCTYLVYMGSTCFVPMLKFAAANPKLRREALTDRRFQKLLLGTMVCGLASGLGGLISTLAFAQGSQHSAIVSMIENGVYTVSGALLIAIIFRETPTLRQLLSAGLVVAGLLVSAAS